MAIDEKLKSFPELIGSGNPEAHDYAAGLETSKTPFELGRLAGIAGCGRDKNPWPLASQFSPGAAWDSGYNLGEQERMGEQPKIVHLDKPPTPKIVNVTFPKCGTCIFAQKFDAQNMADCFGNPPTVIPLGVTKDIVGRPGIRLELFVPRIHRDRPACALHKPKTDFATLGSS